MLPLLQFWIRDRTEQRTTLARLTGGDGVKEILQTTLFDSIEDKEALKKLIQTGGDTHLDAVVAQTPLPLLKGVLKSSSSE